MSLNESIAEGAAPEWLGELGHAAAEPGHSIPAPRQPERHAAAYASERGVEGGGVKSTLEASA